MSEEGQSEIEFLVCDGHDCPLRKRCICFVSTREDWRDFQLGYFDDPPYVIGEDGEATCDYFVDHGFEKWPP